MKVTVLFFASLREQVGRPREELELPANVATVGALRDHLRARGGAWDSVFAPNKPVRAAVNQDMVQPAAAIKNGDEVAFFPPVTGG
ncbi:MAG: molybdopterin converting factor subunit 1 [Betaproteobacteria bacterium]|nr:molybdopterin converting factor subunit 1 [Betaproteobacteria bacterium]